MKKFLLFLAALCLAACAGNPPDWWNPAGMYSTQTQQTVSQKQSSESVATAVKAEQEVPAEENIETNFEEYEELNLTVNGEITQPSPATAQIAPADEDATEQADPMYAPEEDLPADGSLPIPTVLQ